MKNIRNIFFLSFSFLLILPGNTFTQEVKHCKMLGKTLKDVRKSYGAPTFENLDDKTMQWIFYQMGSDRITFVSNEKLVFQVQADITCINQKETNKKVDAFLKDCNVNQMKIDTLKDGNFKIRGNGINLELYLWENLSRGAYGFKYKAAMDTAAVKPEPSASIE